MDRHPLLYLLPLLTTLVQTHSYRFSRGGCAYQRVECQTGPGRQPTVDGYKRGCISIASLCDGYENCLDGSDEKYCPYTLEVSTTVSPANSYRFSQGVCWDNYFECQTGFSTHESNNRNGRGCFRVQALCDGYKQCFDSSDEKYCPYTLDVTTTEPPIQTDSYRFSQGVCWPDFLQCETGLSQELSVRNGRGCFHTERLCDGYEQCFDGSDEKYCPYTLDVTATESPVASPVHTGSVTRPVKTDSYRFFAGECGEGYLECKSGSRSYKRKIGQGKACFRIEWLCDGYKQCLDGSDENYCPYTLDVPTTKSLVTSPVETDLYRFSDGVCWYGYLECQTGLSNREDSNINGKGCFRTEWLCDGYKQCLDGSDEKYCPYTGQLP